MGGYGGCIFGAWPFQDAVDITVTFRAETPLSKALHRVRCELQELSRVLRGLAFRVRVSLRLRMELDNLVCMFRR